MKTKDRILILDGHTNQALACVRSLGKAGYKVVVASHQRMPLSAWSRYSAGSFHLKGQTVEAFRALREWAIRKGVTIVLPLTERSCVLCNADRAEWENAGVTLGCAPDEMLQAAFNKAITVRRAQALGVSVPRTLIPESLDEALSAVNQIGFPCVIKPRWSNAWNGKTFLPTQSPTYANDRDQLLQVLSSHNGETSWPLLQSFVPGRGKGVFALCDRGKVVAWFAHERLRDTRPTGSSSSLRRSAALDPRLIEPAQKLLADFEWHGPAMVEFRDDGVNPPHLMEVNGRFWGSLQLAIDSGVNFPALWVSILKGEAVEPISDFKVGQTLRWLSGDIKRLFFIMRGAPTGYTGDFPSIRQGLKEVFGRQPAGTRLEVVRGNDPLPALGELIGGIRDLVRWRDRTEAAKPVVAPALRLAPPTNGRGSLIKTSNGHGSQSSIVIREATREELNRWDDLVMSFDNYRVSHKLAWIHSLQSTVKGQALFLVYEKSNRIVGCIPGFLTHIGPLRLFGSPLQGWQTVSMGPVFDPNAVSTDELVSPLIDFLETRYGVHHVEIISSDLDQQVLEDLRFRNESLPTFRAPLFPDNQDRSMRMMKDSARRNVKRAIKLGLEVKFEEDESFVDEHYDQLREVFARGGNSLPFGKKRALDFFRYMRAGGNLIAVSVYLPNNGPNIATGMFTIEGRELLLWMWTHRTEYRWYRPTELMTWSVMKKAMDLGCDTFDFMGRGDFKAKFGAELDLTKHRWSWSRYEWLAISRTLAGRGYKWQQAVRGRMIRRVLFNGHTVSEPEGPPGSELKGAA
ncbi:MAG TPA: GNAT family N-acetyltransferase [Pyrinomonadaceae bacterium]|nr:GNAT family N-acetyltransferase [Pyrinomonadaceae bacterium]